MSNQNYTIRVDTSQIGYFDRKKKKKKEKKEKKEKEKEKNRRKWKRGRVPVDFCNGARVVSQARDQQDIPISL